MNFRSLSHARTHTASRSRTRFRLNSTPALLCASALLCACAAGVRAQQQSSTAPPEDDEVLTVRTDLVTFPVFVTDARGRRVRSLAAPDFSLRVDDRPAEIRYFAAGTSRVALVFALDASGSARDHISRQREAAQALLSRFGRGSRVGVLAFAERAALLRPVSPAAELSPEYFRIGARRNGRSAIFDAALASVRALEGGSAASPAERRIVVLLSDGLDTASTTRPAAVVEEARGRGVSIYVIHLPLFTALGDRLAVRRPSKGFRELAAQTGGRYFLLGDERQALDLNPAYDLAPVFDAIADDLQSQYVLGFYADDSARDSREHTVGVTLTRGGANSKLRVHAMREAFVLKP